MSSETEAARIAELEAELAAARQDAQRARAALRNLKTNISKAVIPNNLYRITVLHVIEDGLKEGMEGEGDG